MRLPLPASASASAALTHKYAVSQREIGFGGAADAAEMQNRFAFAVLT
jgi:hypothetical protein